MANESVHNSLGNRYIVVIGNIPHRGLGTRFRENVCTNGIRDIVLGEYI